MLWIVALAWVSAQLAVPASALPLERLLDQCRIDGWAARDGLPSSQVAAVAQTPDGFIWLATSNGLVRFDGSSFAVFNSSNTPGLTTDLVRSLAVDANGTLWIGTEWDGFGPFVNGRFMPCWPAVRHWHRVVALQPLPDGEMAACVADEDNSASGIYRVRNGRVIPPPPHSLGPVVGLALLRGHMICAPQYTPPVVVDKLGKVTVFGPAQAFAGKKMTSVGIDREGGVWLGTEHDGLISVRSGKARSYTVRDGLSSNTINCIFADREGALWIGTNNGIDKWDGSRFTNFGKAQGLYASDVQSIAEDREGNLWAGSGSGLNRFAATKLVPYSLAVNSVASHVYGISSTYGEAVWCATDTGLWKLLPSGPAHVGLPSGLPRSYADGVCVAPDRSVYVWFNQTTSVAPLWRLIPSGNGFIAKPSQKPANHWSIATGVADSTGVTFFGSSIMMRMVNGVETSQTKIDTGWVFHVAETAVGEYWVGCMNGLVHVRNGVSARMNEGLPPGTHVLGIDTTDPSCLWLATDKGLARFRDGRSTVFTMLDGLPDANLFQIQRAPGGTLWIGGLHGLFTIRTADIDAYEQHRIHRIPSAKYSAEDGICSYFDLFSAERTADGRLWFAGHDGVTMVDPGHIAVNNFPPPVVIEGGAVDQTPLSTSSSISIPPGDGRLHVSFAALSYAAPEQVRFRYRLEGFDNAWVESSRRFADYTNLPPGNYRFDVTACNNDGIWNSVGASVSFRLRPHYYQTIWFRGVIILIGIALIGLAFAWRVRQVVRHNAILEQVVAARTAELRDSNDQLQAAQEELTAQNHELEIARDYLEQRVADRTRELENAYDRTIEGWSYVMDLRDKETEGHSRRVTDVTVRMAEAMGLTGDDLDNVRRGALLHDIGKMGVPDGVLLKPGPLNDEEWKVMRMHPVYAYDILSQIDYLKAAVDIPWCHHEKWDGTGYPRGLKGEEIPLAARMFSIVDVWDALRSDRPYREGWPEEKVFAHLQSLAGTHFQLELVALFFRVMQSGRDLRSAAETGRDVETKAA